MKIELDNKLHLHGAPAELAAELRAYFAVANPEYISARKAGRYTGHMAPTQNY